MFGSVCLCAVVNTRGRGIEKAFHARVARGHEQMGVDEHAQHAQAAVQLDETHAAHVGGEIIDLLHVFGRALTGIF